MATSNASEKVARRLIRSLLTYLAVLLTCVGARMSHIIRALAPRTLSAAAFPAPRDVPKGVPAGGLLELPPDPPEGNNVISNPSLESGGTGWTLDRCWSIDNSTGHQGTHSLRYDAGPDCPASSIAFTLVPRDQGAPRSYSMRAWVKTSEGSDIKVRLTLHDRNDRSYALGGTRYNFVPGPTWQLIDANNTDLLAVHDGHTLSVFAMVDGHRGSAWFDSIELTERPPPALSVFLSYPNYRGFLWSSGPQDIRFHADA